MKLNFQALNLYFLFNFYVLSLNLRDVYLWPMNKAKFLSGSKDYVPAGAFKWSIQKVDDNKDTIRNVEFDEPLFVSSLFWVIYLPIL